MTAAYDGPQVVSAERPRPDPQLSSWDRRRRLICDLRRLLASRRSRAALLGLVGRRAAGGGAVAAVSSAESRLSAAARFRSWERCSAALTVSTPS